MHRFYILHAGRGELNWTETEKLNRQIWFSSILFFRTQFGYFLENEVYFFWVLVKKGSVEVLNWTSKFYTYYSWCIILYFLLSEYRYMYIQLCHMSDYYLIVYDI